MNHIIQLRQEIAQERLMDLLKQYGMKSTRVNNYKNRMKDVLFSNTLKVAIDLKTNGDSLTPWS